MSDGIAAFNTLLKKGDGGSPETFSTIAEVLDISGPKLSMDTDETTNHSSSGGWKEYVGTLIDGGEVTFDVNFLPTAPTQDATTGLMADLINKTLRNFQLVLPDAGTTTFSFAALVTGFEPDEPLGAKLKASVTLKISGAVTFA